MSTMVLLPASCTSADSDTVATAQTMQSATLPTRAQVCAYDITDALYTAIGGTLNGDQTAYGAGAQTIQFMYGLESPEWDIYTELAGKALREAMAHGINAADEIITQAVDRCEQTYPQG